MKFTALLLGATFILHGKVDSVTSGMARVELATPQYEQGLDIPVLLFPCRISEGDSFYALAQNGPNGDWIEIRCGDPPE